jgi:hypothetical protein
MDSRAIKESIATLLATGLGIERLVLGSFHADSPALTGILQGLDPAKRGVYRKAFVNLKCLEILLPIFVQKEENNVIRTIELNYGGISAIIQSAPQLEELPLAFNMASQAPLPRCFVDSLQIPKLRALRRASACVRGPSCLVRFCCRHATALKILELSELCIQTSSWERVFTGPRERLSLDKKHNLQSLGAGTHDETWTSRPHWCTSAGIRRQQQYKSSV